MSSHQITPDETHVIKAMAWDALGTAFNLKIGLEVMSSSEEKLHKEFLEYMDAILARVGDTVSKSKTWELGMAKKFKNDLYYKCVACGTATKKGDWEPWPGLPPFEGVAKCPHCGGYFDLSVGNVIEPVEEVVQEPDAPEPKKPAAKKSAAKK